MWHGPSRSAMATLVLLGLWSVHAAWAQETPVVTELSNEHANGSASQPLTGFGQAVAIEGRLALVGVPQYLVQDSNGHSVLDGIVEIYAGNADGSTWTRTGSLFPPDPDHEVGFGNWIALNGKRLAVGSSDGAAVELFVMRHSQWLRRGSITMDSGYVAGTLAYHGDALAVAVSQPQVSSAPIRSVYIYRVDPRGRAHLLQKLAPFSSDTGEFGQSLALHRHLLVVGSPGSFDAQNPQLPGQVYAYSQGRERWHLQQTIPSPSGAPNSEFGAGVAIGDDAILVGAPREDFEGQYEFTFAEGELYVFRKADGLWGEVQKTRPSGVGAFADFGQTIATGGGRVAVGAPRPTDAYGGDFGPTVIFRWDGDLLVQDNSVDMLLATSLAASRNRIIVGENYENEKYGFFNRAVVLTYPGSSGSNNR